MTNVHMRRCFVRRVYLAKALCVIVSVIRGLKESVHLCPAADVGRNMV